MDILQEFYGLAGSVALLVGSGSGIGKASARAMAGAGARVVVADLEMEYAEATAAEIRDLGYDALAAHVDVGDEASIVALFRRVQAEFGRLDILVNFAADYHKFPIFEASVDEWDDMQRITLRGTYLTMREGVKMMTAAGNGGRIVNFSSVASLTISSLDSGGYAAAKGGVNALTKHAAYELADKGITVNAIAPGSIMTERGQRLMQTGKMRAVKGPATSPDRWPMKRLGTPNDVAAAVLFLVSPSASFITGHILVVDGGFLLG